MFNGRPNDYITAIRSGNSAAYQDYFLGFAHLHHLKILNCYTLTAEVTWRSLVFPNASRRRTISNGADAPMRLRAVGRALSVEVVLLHYALKSFSFRSTDYIDEIACLKLRDAQIDIAFRKVTLQAKLAHKFVRLDSGFLELPKQRLGNPRFLLHAETNLHGRISLVLFGQPAQ